MNNILQMCIEKGYLIEKDLLTIFDNLNSIDAEASNELLNIFLGISRDKILKKKIFLDNINKLTIILLNLKEKKEYKKENIEKIIKTLNLFRKDLNIEFKNFEQDKFIEEDKKSLPEIKNGVKIISSPHILSKKIGIEDFVKHFRNRFSVIKNILQEHNELQNLVSINKISGQKQNISIIGMVAGKRITKNKNMLLYIEDLTGRITLLVNQNRENVFSKAKDIIEDDILGFKCSGNEEILFVNEIIFPDITAKPKKNIENEEFAIFISDLHAGSNKFLEQEFLQFLKWVNGEIGSAKQKEISKKIKYIFIIGDLVDGIGIYPGQEDELVIKDITKQYEKVAELLSSLRKDITIIVSPGNHDSVRIAEPQPILDEKFASSLYKIPNILFVSNPSIVNIASSNSSSGIDILLYHGYSFDYYANTVDSLRLNKSYHRPTLLSHFLLKRRHLAPTHASTLYIPSDHDSLIINEVPDVFASAHIHKSDISNYNGITTICCSCWQAKTPFQEKVGHEPDPCKVPILNLKTGQVNIIDFS